MSYQHTPCHLPAHMGAILEAESLLCRGKERGWVAGRSHETIKEDQGHRHRASRYCSAALPLHTRRWHFTYPTMTGIWARYWGVRHRHATQTCSQKMFIWLGTRQTSTIDPLSHSTVHRRPHWVCPQHLLPTTVPLTNKHLFHEAH